MSGRAVEAPGDVDVLLLDKTGTITLGNRQAVAFLPAPGVTDAALADAAQLASLADETPGGRSIVVLAKDVTASASATVQALGARTFVPFTAQTRMSGVDLEAAADPQGRGGRDHATVEQQGRALRRGARVVEEVAQTGRDAARRRREGARARRDPAQGHREGRHPRALPASCAAWASRPVMITGDNPLTAAAIAAEAGVDDFLAEATPEAKLALIRELPEGGRLVAMTGDGTNDAPALAQADVGGRDEHRHAGGQRPATWSTSTRTRPSSSRSSRIGKQLLDDARRADDVQRHRERRREVLRDHPRGVREHVPDARRAQRDASRHAAERSCRPSSSTRS